MSNINPSEKLHLPDQLHRRDAAYHEAVTTLRDSYGIDEPRDIDSGEFDEFNAVVGGWQSYVSPKLPTDRTPGRRRRVDEMVVMEKAFPENLVSAFHRHSLPSRAGVRKHVGSISVRDEKITSHTLLRVCDIELYMMRLRARTSREQRLGGLAIGHERGTKLTVTEHAVLAHVHLPRTQAAANLGVAPATFGAHLAHIRAKLSIDDIDTLARLAYETGYIPDADIADIGELSPFEYAIAQQYAIKPRRSLPEATGYTSSIIHETITRIYKKMGISTRRQLILALLKEQKNTKTQQAKT